MAKVQYISNFNLCAVYLIRDRGLIFKWLEFQEQETFDYFHFKDMTQSKAAKT